MPIIELYQIVYETKSGNIPTNGLVMADLDNIVKSIRTLIKSDFYKPKTIQIYLGKDIVNISCLPRDVEEQLYVPPVQQKFETRD